MADHVSLMLDGVLVCVSDEGGDELEWYPHNHEAGAYQWAWRTRLVLRHVATASTGVQDVGA